MANQKPSIGRIVQYSFKAQDGTLHTRPAMVVRVFGEPTETSAANLRVFFDGANDDLPDGPRGEWRTSVAPSDDGKPQDDRYNWPEITR